MNPKVLRNVGLLVLAFLSVQCGELPKIQLPQLPTQLSPSSSPSQCNEASIPKQSADASACLYLTSNVNCNYFVDAKPMAIGRDIRILVTEGDHEVVCAPICEGGKKYKEKEEFIRPPFDPYHPIRFTFLETEKIRCRQ